MKQEREYKVYIHRCLINLKIYVGITKTKIKERWRKSGNGYKNQPLFYNAIQKYGWDNFEHIVLFDNLTKQEAEEIEIELIYFHKSNNKNFGYNIENGGSANGKCSENTKIKLSQINKGKHVGQKNYFYNKHQYGEDNPFFGHKHTIESRKKMSDARKGKYAYQKHPRAKKIICLDTEEIFDCIKSASEKYNLHHSDISRVCKGKLKTTGKLHFLYYEDYIKNKEN